MAIDENKLKNVLHVITTALIDHKLIDDDLHISIRGAIHSVFTEEPGSKKPLKIEVGKFYKTMLGRKVFIYTRDGDLFSGLYSGNNELEDARWGIHGNFRNTPCNHDLIEEVE